MERKFISKTFVLALFVVLILVMITACGSKNESSTPNGTSQGESNTTASGNTQARISIATNPVGSAFNSLGNGLASVISSNSDIHASVQPFAGPTTWGPSLDRGEIALGVANGPELIWAFNGEHDFEEPLKNMRLLVRGNYISATGAVVREDSGIKSVADLRGKRVAANYPGSIIGKMILEATLASNGVTWDDTNTVPVPTIVAGIEALQDNRLDAAFALVPSSPVMMEAHNAVGLYALSFIDNITPAQINEVPQQVLEEIISRVPSARLTIVPPEGYVAEETVGIEYPSMMVASTHLADETVYQLMETLWVHYEELHPVHAWFKTWNPELMFDPQPGIPYHPGAVQFFKDKGIWNDDVEKIQENLLKLASS